MLIKMSGAKLNHQQQNTTITTNNTLNDLNTGETRDLYNK